MNPKHTPGPWSFNGRSSVNAETVIGLAIVAGNGEAETIANCKLIAAAPELLNALKACLDQLEYEPKLYSSLLERAYKLIEKVEGAK